MVRSRPNEDMAEVLEEISDFLRENNQKPVCIFLWREKIFKGFFVTE